jgi:hypothetical protein
MHPMFAELFMKPDEEREADDQRRVRRPRRSPQLRTGSAARGRPSVSRAVLAGRRTS